eukprot:scaffold117515_cov62-Phaeocystis_antarctica.AAC.1
MTPPSPRRLQDDVRAHRALRVHVVVQAPHVERDQEPPPRDCLSRATCEAGGWSCGRSEDRGPGWGQRGRWH